MIEAIKKVFLNGSDRTVKAKKNIALSVIFKVFNIVIQLLLVPLLLGYLDPAKYGIWITINSFISWFYMFDIGLGNGLRNKLAEAFAKGEKEKGRIYISTSYVILSGIVLIFYLGFLVVDQFIDWQSVFNAPDDLKSEINILMIFVFTFFAINFVTRLIGSILNADQKNSLNDLFYTISNFLTLIVVLILKQVSNGSLVYVGIASGIATVVPTLFGTFIFFSRYYKNLRPSWSFFRMEYVRELTFLGGKFLVMRVAWIILFTTDSLIITHLFGPAQVTPYEIALKYFNIIQMLFLVGLTPFWTAFTEAYTKNDYNWIKNIISKLIKIWGATIFVLAFMVLISKFVIGIWLGDGIDIPYSLSTFFALYIAISLWNNIFAFFINGVGKLKVSLITSSINIVLNIPLSIILAKYVELGLVGVILGTCVSLSIGAVIKPIQYYKIINFKDSGLWGK